MSLNTIDEIIDDFRQGKPVILMDDEDRENEGDLMVAADCVTPEIINFMAKEARGLICLTLTGERCDELELPAMVAAGTEKFGTHFTVSIEAAEGVTTGISAADRARTIQVAVDPARGPGDIVQPGHVFPLRADPGGVLSRAGHTEAGCDLARLAGRTPACAIVEIMNDDGTMARRPDLEKFARKHGFKVGTIADLIHYRLMNERTVQLLETEPVTTPWGRFDLRVYEDRIHGGHHLTLSQGSFVPHEPTLVRVHAPQMLRDLLGVDTGGWSLRQALSEVNRAGQGVVVLIDQSAGTDITQELTQLRQRPDASGTARASRSGSYVTIGTGAQILRELRVGKMRLMSSPLRFGGISGFDLEIVETVPSPTESTEED